MIAQGYAQDIGNLSWAKVIAEKLNAHYPGHLWAVTVEGGAAIIKNLRISSMYGYVIHLKTIYADPSLKCVVHAGGEILERAAIERKRSDGQKAKHVEGIAPQHQPISGIII